MNPEDIFIRFCPVCGKDAFNPVSEKKYECKACHFTYFQNVATAGAVIIEYKDKILFTVRRKEPSKGMFDLPGGFMDNEETAEEGMQREIREELNLELPNLHYLASFPNKYQYKGIIYNTMDLIFTSRIENIQGIVPRDDVLDYSLVSLENIDWEKISFPSIKKAIETYIKKDTDSGY